MNTSSRDCWQALEKHWKTIRDEGLAQLNSKTGKFEAEDENLRETGDWKQLMLYQKGCYCRTQSYVDVVWTLLGSVSPDSFSV